MWRRSPARTAASSRMLRPICACKAYVLQLSNNSDGFAPEQICRHIWNKGAEAPPPVRKAYHTIFRFRQQLADAGVVTGRAWVNVRIDWLQRSIFNADRRSAMGGNRTFAVTMTNDCYYENRLKVWGSVAGRLECGFYRLT